MTAFSLLSALRRGAKTVRFSSFVAHTDEVMEMGQEADIFTSPYVRRSEIGSFVSGSNCRRGSRLMLIITAWAPHVDPAGSAGLPVRFPNDGMSTERRPHRSGLARRCWNESNCWADGLQPDPMDSLSATSLRFAKELFHDEA